MFKTKMSTTYKVISIILIVVYFAAIVGTIVFLTMSSIRRLEWMTALMFLPMFLFLLVHILLLIDGLKRNSPSKQRDIVLFIVNVVVSLVTCGIYIILVGLSAIGA